MMLLSDGDCPFPCLVISSSLFAAGHDGDDDEKNGGESHQRQCPVQKLQRSRLASLVGEFGWFDSGTSKHWCFLLKELQWTIHIHMSLTFGGRGSYLPFYSYNLGGWTPPVYYVLKKWTPPVDYNLKKRGPTQTWKFAKKKKKLNSL